MLSCLLGLCDLQRYEEVDLLVESAMEFYSFYDNKPRRKELEFFGLSATVLNQNYYKAYNYIRCGWRNKSSVCYMVTVLFLLILGFSSSD